MNSCRRSRIITYHIGQPVPQTVRLCLGGIGEGGWGVRGGYVLQTNMIDCPHFSSFLLVEVERIIITILLLY